MDSILVKIILENDQTILDSYKKYYGDFLINEGMIEWNSLQIFVTLYLAIDEIYDKWIENVRPDLKEKNLSEKISQLFMHFHNNGVLSELRDIIDNDQKVGKTNNRQYYDIYELSDDVINLRPKHVNAENIDNLIRSNQSLIESDIFKKLYKVAHSSLLNDIEI